MGSRPLSTLQSLCIIGIFFHVSIVLICKIINIKRKILMEMSIHRHPYPPFLSLLLWTHTPLGNVRCLTLGQPEILRYKNGSEKVAQGNWFAFAQSYKLREESWKTYTSYSYLGMSPPKWEILILILFFLNLSWENPLPFSRESLVFKDQDPSNSWGKDGKCFFHSF